MLVKLKNVRLGFSALFVPTAYDQTKPNESRAYKAQFYIAKSDVEQIKAINAAIVEEAKKAFGPKAKAMVDTFKGNPLKYCFRDGDTDLSQSGEPKMPGFYILGSRRSEFTSKGVKNPPPNVFDNRGTNGKVNTLTEGSSRIYEGCYVNCNVDIWAQAKVNPGVRCNLLAVQYKGPGEPFGGTRPTDASEFDIDETELASVEEFDEDELAF